MASRFGAASPAQTYATKVRWLVGCLVSIIIVLAAAFIIVANNSGTKNDGQAVATDIQPAQPALLGKSEILVAVARIEEGTQLKENMFNAVLLDEAQAPLGALRKKDLVLILDKFAKRQINPNVPLVAEDVSEKRGYSALNIPAGYRAVTIVVDRRAGVEFFARPDSRVDVLWTFVKDGKQQVATIVRFVKILSVGGVTAQAAQGGAAPAADQQGVVTVTLLATEIDAKKIELARTLGSISLSLVGEVEPGATSLDTGQVTIADLIQGEEGKGEPEAPAADGILYSTDPSTGKQVRFVLPNGSRRWVRDKNL